MRVYTGGVADERKTATGSITAAEMPTTTTASKVEEAGRLPSIEMEPKTLTLDQIKYAREAALYVVSTKSEEEAIRIFTAGLKPVQMNTNGRKSGNSMDVRRRRRPRRRQRLLLGRPPRQKRLRALP